jgi:hypothetical protein
MDEVTDKEINQVNKLADKLLEVVMNTEMESPAIAVTALGHVASMIAYEVQFSEQAFMYCMLDCFRTVVELEKRTEVH